MTMMYDPSLIAWNEFIQNRRILPTVNPVIADSWKRCRPRLNPYQKASLNRLSTDTLLATQVASFDLISVARPIMEDIHQYIEHSNTAVILTNGTGYLISMLGDGEMLATAEEFGILTGALISEAQIGTNAFSLAIQERIPVRVHGAEHFLEPLHCLAVVAAPIFDISGRPLGALGLLNLANEQHDHSLGLVIAGARAIEGQRQTDQLLVEQNNQLAGLNAILGAISEGILVWNAQGILMHINSVAAKILDLSSPIPVGRHINGVMKFPIYVLDALTRRDPLTDVEASLKVGERLISCILSLRFVTKNNELQSTILTLRREKDVRQLVQQQFGVQAQTTWNDLVSESVEMRRVIRMAQTAAAARASILIRGETGTGKNVLASAIHNASQRNEGPFLIFACSTVPNELIVSELLGYEEGMSPKRPGGRPSKFELAQGGTMFFQDIDALPLEAQAILLNVLDLGIVQRLGSDRPIATDVRVIAATSANMEKLVAQGNFRADLLYRLSAFEFTLPPLRERQKDIPLLVERILARLSRQLNRSLTLASGVIELLKKYPWPGNIRELESVISRAAIQAGLSEVIGPMHLTENVRQPINLAPKEIEASSAHSLSELERQALLRTAHLCNGNVSQMARVLGLGRTTVWRKLKEFGISVDAYRNAPVP